MSLLNSSLDAEMVSLGAGLPDEAAETLDARDFEAFRQLIYGAAGIQLSQRKVPMLSNRLRRRMRALGLRTYREYYKLLTQAGSGSDEFFRFLEVVTTNETYFFRNRPLWNALEAQVLPALVQRRPASQALTFWSAASSSGEEPYTLAVLLHTCRASLAGRSVRILASDISQRQLATARVARYDTYAVSRLTDAERRQYFHRQAEQYQLRDEFRRPVEFFFHNLKMPMRRGPVDCVILRNVMMYFDQAMQEQTLVNACDALQPGGFLVVGDVDHLHTQVDLMDRLGVRYVRTWVYEKL